MYLHIGKECVINSKDIIGIFNIKYIKNTKEYKKMYELLETEKSITDISDSNIKSFILVENNGKNFGYITKLVPNTIGKRKLRGGKNGEV